MPGCATWSMCSMLLVWIKCRSLRAVLRHHSSPPGPHRSQKRMTDRARAIFARYPQLAHAFARLLSRRTSAPAIEKLWRKSAEGVASDEAILNDPIEMADIVRGAQQAALGLNGFLNEALSLGKGPQPRRVQNASGWTALFGSGYERHDVSDATRFWAEALPGGTIMTVPDGVHFLHITHLDTIIEALHRASGDLGKIGESAKKAA
jgi:hypothetical protein